MPNNYLYGHTGILFVTYSLSHSIDTYQSHSHEFSGSFLSSSEISYTASNYINPTSSFTITSDTEGNNIKISIPSQSSGLSEDLTPLFITRSNSNTSIGLGNDNPLSRLDIRSNTSSLPADIILRTNEDGIISPGEETGRIIFAIESSSYLGSNLIQSGSTAAIFSRVINSGSGFSDSTHGSLIFEVNDSTNRTYSIEIFTLGVGLTE